MTPEERAALEGILRKVSRDEALTPEEAALYQRVTDANNAEAQSIAESMFGAGAAGSVTSKAGGIVRGLLGAANKHRVITGAAVAGAAWKSKLGDDPEVTGPSPADAAAIQAIITKVASGEALTPAEMMTLQKADPELAAQVSPEGGDGTGAGGTEPVSGEGSNADVLDRVLRALVSQPDYDAQQVAQIATAAKNARDVEKKQLTLEDGTIITQAMIQNADPVTRAQYEQELATRSARYENDALDLLNAFDLQQYATGRTAVNDANTNANNDFRNRVESIRQRLELDKINIDQANSEVSRLLQGMGESRARTTLETETALKAAPWATSGGKAEFTGNDLGAAVTGLARIGGVRNPETTPLIKFPGTIRIDPAARMAAQDAALGVGGALPAIPKITVGAGEIPSAPGLRAGPAAPVLRAPVRPPAINIPITPEDYALAQARARGE